MRTIFPLASRCGNCQHTVLGVLASLVGISLRPIPSSAKLPIRALSLKRGFQTIISRRTEFIHQKDEPSGHDTIEVSSKTQPESFKVENPESTSSIPWYLQVNIPQQTTSPLSERQRLPELPQNSPQLLQPILEYISIDLGLDDLSLFDLRKIDPPTALGANLLMIIGTSRSERHLHVSADRFCRWLRHTHKLSPYADGLLGRGELKLKLKRIARRAKLLSSVGSSEGGNVDNGLRTGWVCVNLGTIEDNDNAAEPSTLPEGFVGFGGRLKGTRVVVQMLTEEKREELNLEDLWGGMLVRYERKKARNLKLAEESGIHQQVGQIPPGAGARFSIKPSSISSNGQKSLRTRGQQGRSFHTITRFCEMSVNYKTDADRSSINPCIAKPEIPLKFGSESLNLNIQLSTMEELQRKLEKEAEYIPEQYRKSKFFITRKLKAHIYYLQYLPREDALKALGRGFNDFSSTSFLVSFFQSFPLFPSSHQWNYRWALVCYAIAIGHQKYKKEHLMLLFREIRASGVEVPKGVYDKVLEILLSREDCLPSTTFPCFRKLDEALEILEEMIFCSRWVPNEAQLIGLYCTLANLSVQPLESDKQFRLRPDALQRLRYILDSNGIELTDLKTSLRLLETYADNNNWLEFWSHWRGFAKRMQPKPKELYCLMFQRLARTGHQMDCMDALRTWIPEMEQEEPPVKLGEVSVAVLECLRVAEPDAESDSQDRQNQESEWVKLLRRCKGSFLNPRTSDFLSAYNAGSRAPRSH